MKISKTLTILFIAKAYEKHIQSLKRGMVYFFKLINRIQNVIINHNWMSKTGVFLSCILSVADNLYDWTIFMLCYRKVRRHFHVLLKPSHFFFFILKRNSMVYAILKVKELTTFYEVPKSLVAFWIFLFCSLIAWLCPTTRNKIQS